jgi:7-cyano-7-deazaguanine synthase
MSQIMRKAFVLLSGGLDSTTCLHQAILDFAPKEYEPGEVHTRLTRLRDEDPLKVDWVEAISIDYGQRHIKEAEYAAKTCESFGIKHTTIDVSGLLGESMLTDPTMKIPDISYSEIKGVSPTYVPNRNMTMLSILGAKAQLWVNERIKELEEGGYDSKDGDATNRMKDAAGIYFGAHADDALNWAYPDCTPEFIGAMANAIYMASYHCVRLFTPIQWMLKQDVVTLGQQIGVRFEDTWSCYKGEELQCGVCPTCRSRKDAFLIANVYDPTQYAA